MGDLVLLAIFVGIICLVAVILTKQMNKNRRPQLWTVVEHSLPGAGVMLYLERPGEKSLPVTKTPILLDANFDYHIELARNDADIYCNALNAKIKRELAR